MDKNKILTNLCWYDERNPDNEDVEEKKERKGQACSCDNCFYGRHQLANYILILLENDTNRLRESDKSPENA